MYPTGFMNEVELGWTEIKGTKMGLKRKKEKQMVLR